MQKILYSPTSYLPMVNMSLSKFNFNFCLDESHDESLSQISFLSYSLLVDFYLFKRMGARLDPGYKMQEHFFEWDDFIGSIMNFYEKVRETYSKTQVSHQTMNILYGKPYILNS